MPEQNISKEQINKVFEILGLGNQEHLAYPPYAVNAAETPAKDIVLPRLSDSSIPLPSGSIADANLEKFN